MIMSLINQANEFNQIISKRGLEIYKQRVLLNSILNDIFPGNIFKEKKCLDKAVQCGIPEELLRISQGRNSKEELKKYCVQLNGMGFSDHELQISLEILCAPLSLDSRTVLNNLKHEEGQNRKIEMNSKPKNLPSKHKKFCEPVKKDDEGAKEEALQKQLKEAEAKRQAAEEALQSELKKSKRNRRRKRRMMWISLLLLTAGLYIGTQQYFQKQIPVGAYEWNGHYYECYENCSTWEEAKQYCESLHGHLATITSDEENNAIYTYITTSGYSDAYFGLNDSMEEGVFCWVTGEESIYTNWYEGEPNNCYDTEDFAMFYHAYTDGAWNDGDFGNHSNGGKVFICEWDGKLADLTDMFRFYSDIIQKVLKSLEV